MRSIAKIWGLGEVSIAGSHEIALYIPKLAETPIKERLRFWGRFFLDYPYIDSPLGEGDITPRIRTDGFDCMTYVETCLALALSDSADSILGNLDRIRYRNGIVDFEHRNHFVSIDWLPNNSWLLHPLEESADSVIERNIDRAGFFEKQGRVFRENSGLPAVQSVKSKIITPLRIGEMPPQKLDSTIIMFAGKLDWLVVSHMGLLFEEDGEVLLYHASSVSRKIVRLPLGEYFAINFSLKGAIVAEISA